MERHHVSSSAIRSVGYDVETQTLEIEFAAGTVYEYKPVPSSLYTAFDQAESRGAFFDQYIKNAGFAYRRLQ